MHIYHPQTKHGVNTFDTNLMNEYLKILKEYRMKMNSGQLRASIETKGNIDKCIMFLQSSLLTGCKDESRLKQVHEYLVRLQDHFPSHHSSADLTGLQNDNFDKHDNTNDNSKQNDVQVSDQTNDAYTKIEGARINTKNKNEHENEDENQQQKKKGKTTKCPYCESFYTRGYIKQHCRKKHPQKVAQDWIKCPHPTCKESFINKDALEAHMSKGKHKRARLRLNAACPSCGKSHLTKGAWDDEQKQYTRVFCNDYKDCRYSAKYVGDNGVYTKRQSK